MLNKLIFIFLIIIYASLGLSVDQPKLGLINQVCAVVESERPILQSEVEKRAKERLISLLEAQTQLIGERALWIYAKQQLKFNVPEIYKSAQEHVKKIMETNNLSQESFEASLMLPPYNMTLKHYEHETAFLILKNQLESSITNIEISDKEIEAEYKQHPNKYKEFEVIFISLSTPANNNNIKPLLSAQFVKANQIKKRNIGQ